MILAASDRWHADKVGDERRSVSIRTTAISLVRGGTIKGWNPRANPNAIALEVERAGKIRDRRLIWIDEIEILTPFPRPQGNARHAAHLIGAAGAAYCSQGARTARDEREEHHHYPGRVKDSQC